MNDIRRDNERARQGIKPKILNEIPMRTPAKEDLSRMMPIETEVARETNE
jgi:hypothetical protein